MPWIQALIWAFKPTDVIDIRRFPAEEERATEAEIRRLSGKPAAEKPREVETKDEKPERGSEA